MADYLTDEEQADRLKRWWDQNGTALVVGVALAVAAVVGWRYYQTYTTNRDNDASAAYMAYLEARETGEPTTDLLATLDSEYTGSGYHVFALLHRAADQVEEEDWEEALAYLERAAELTDSQVIADTARYRAAKVLYQLGRLDQALAQLAKIRSAGFRVDVAELSGDIHIANDDPAAARAAYVAGVEAAGQETANPPNIELLELKLSSMVDQE